MKKRLPEGTADRLADCRSGVGGTRRTRMHGLRPGLGEGEEAPLNWGPPSYTGYGYVSVAACKYLVC